MKVEQLYHELFKIENSANLYVLARSLRSENSTRNSDHHITVSFFPQLGLIEESFF